MSNRILLASSMLMFVAGCGDCPYLTFPRTEKTDIAAATIAVDDGTLHSFTTGTFSVSGTNIAPFFDFQFGPALFAEGNARTGGGTLSCQMSHWPANGTYTFAELCNCSTPGCSHPSYSVMLSFEDSIVVPLDSVDGIVTISLEGDMAHVFDLSLGIDLPKTDLVGTDTRKTSRPVSLELRNVHTTVHQDEVEVPDTCGTDAFGHPGWKG